MKTNYDFERYFIATKPFATPEMIIAFLEDSDNFTMISTKVAKNPYLEANQNPTGLRDLEYSLQVYLTHKNNAADKGVLLTRENLDEPFTINLNSTIPES